MEDKPPQPHKSTGDRWRPLDGDGTDVGEEQQRRRRQEEDDLEELEEEVKEMTQKLAHYRSTFPGQLKCTAARILAAQRLEFPLLYVDGSGPGHSRDPGAGIHADESEGDMAAEGVSAAERFSTIEGVSAAQGDPETVDKLRLLREKVSGNVSAIPVVLKRLNECICRIDKLDSSDEIHPAFKRKNS